MITDRFIFIHVPKTAGQFLRWLISSKKDMFEFLIEDSHLTLLESYKKFFENSHGIENIPSFVFVRNPWDIYVSRFFHRKRLLANGEVSENICLEMFDNTIEGFRKHMFYLQSLLTDNDPLEFFGNKVICDSGEVAKTRTYNFVGVSGWHYNMVYPGVNMIGKYEDFEKDATFILTTLAPGVFGKHELSYFDKKINSSVHLIYKDYYTDYLKDMVKEWDKKYIEEFDYRF